MARIRSPGYPNTSLEQMIDSAAKIHAEDRQHPVDRETAAKHMGFSGLSGASDRALSALLHFGLAEKVRKGELRVTDLALRIIHPNDSQERREALHEAAFSPELFRELRERYPEAPPSRDTLSSYLSRSGFASAAISPATRAYLETCAFLQREGAYDSRLDHQAAMLDGEAESDDIENSNFVDVVFEETAKNNKFESGTQRRINSRELALNEPYLDVRGTREVHIEGIFDRAGLDVLENTIAALKMLLKLKIESPDEGN